MICNIFRLLRLVVIITSINKCMLQHITNNNCIEKSTPIFDLGNIFTFTESLNIYSYVINILNLYKNLQFPIFTSKGNGVVCSNIFDCELFGNPFKFEDLGTNLTAHRLILDMKIISSRKQGFCIMENRIWLLDYCQEFYLFFQNQV